MKRLQIYIDEELDDALAVRARRAHTSKAALIREAVRRSIGEPEPTVGSVPRLDRRQRRRPGARRRGRLRLVRFVDTSYWVALRLRRDANHGVAVRLWTPGQPILTTNQVVGETWTFLRRRDGHPSAVAFLDAVESADWLTVVHVDEATEREARAWLRRHDERVYSFVDATSFAVMRRERLREALAFDGDFRGPRRRRAAACGRAGFAKRSASASARSLLSRTRRR